MRDGCRGSLIAGALTDLSEFRLAKPGARSSRGQLGKYLLDADAPAMNGMAWPLFYRQSGMFVSWLRKQDADAFNHVLRELREGEHLFSAVERRYGRSLPALHRQWKNAAQREKSVELGASMNKNHPERGKYPPNF